MSNFNINFFQTSRVEKKVLIKNSYLLLTWFYYFQFIINFKEKNSVKFCMLPTVKRKFTATRAPIAHRKRSKEQFLYKFFKFKIAYPAFLANNRRMRTLNSGLAFVLLTKKLFPHIETNFFFIKTNRVNFEVSDRDYFNYSRQLMKFKQQ